MKSQTQNKNKIHDAIQEADNKEMSRLVTTRATELLKHARDCPLCDAKWKQAVDRELAEMPPGRRKRLVGTAQKLAKGL